MSLGLSLGHSIGGGGGEGKPPIITVNPVGGVTPGFEYTEPQTLETDTNYDQCQLPSNYVSSESGTIAVVYRAADKVQQAKTYPTVTGELIEDYVQDGAGNFRYFRVDSRVAGIAPSIPGLPTIDNTSPSVGDTLTATLSAPVTGTPAPASTSQWLSDGSLVASDTLTYVTQAGDEGNTIVFRQIETNSENFDTADSLPTDAVTVPIAPTVNNEPDYTLTMTGETGSPLTIDVTTNTEWAGLSQDVELGDLASGPLNIGAPSISGTGAAGQTLTYEDGLTINDDALAAPTISNNWQTSPESAGTWADIPGETGPTLLLDAGDEGNDIRVRENALDANGNRNVFSNVINVPAVGGITDPTDLDVRVWLDGDDWSSQFQDAGGANPIDAVGQQVLRWNDKSGYGQHVVASGAGPLSAADHINMNNARLQSAENFFDLPDNAELYVILRTTVARDDYFILMGKVGYADNNIGLAQDGGSSDGNGVGWAGTKQGSVDGVDTVDNTRGTYSAAWATGSWVTAGVRGIDLLSERTLAPFTFSNTAILSNVDAVGWYLFPPLTAQQRTDFLDWAAAKIAGTAP